MAEEMTFIIDIAESVQIGCLQQLSLRQSNAASHSAKLKGISASIRVMPLTADWLVNASQKREEASKRKHIY